MIPPVFLQQRVDELLSSYAHSVEKRPEDLTTDEIQALAFALRNLDDAAVDNLDEDLALANALDNLSDRSNQDVDYLERLAPAALAD
jgi:predicted DNA-binding transcriptional regulator YafY